MERNNLLLFSTSSQYLPKIKRYKEGKREQEREEREKREVNTSFFRKAREVELDIRKGFSERPRIAVAKVPQH